MSAGQRTIYKLASLTPIMLLASKSPIGQPVRPAIYAQNSCGGLSSWNNLHAENGELVIMFNRLSISAATINWNGIAIDRNTLGDLLKAVRRLSPEPVTALIIKPQADCINVLAVRRMMNKHLLCSAEKMCVEYSEQDWVKRGHRPLSD
jgi:hypothetical protein